MTNRYTIITNSAQETLRLGEGIARFIFRTAVILLEGDLGAGKTTLTGGIARGLDIHETVTSPTFNILRCYFHGQLPLYHIDAYRLEDGTTRNIGLEEFIEGDGVAVIEWPDRIPEWIPQLTLQITITHKKEAERCFAFVSDDERWSPLFKWLKEVFPCTA